jgi:[glutamine synthetase] adenylyltransferase / [glutamine synthetase]-adenylyl-L-tyrosine phosphorylase
VQRGAGQPPRGGSLARFGLTDARADDELRRLDLWSAAGHDPADEPLVAALSRSPDPDLALRALGRLHDAMPGAEWTELHGLLRADAELRGRLLALLGSSTALGDHLIAGPDRWRQLCRDSGETDYTAELLAAVDGLTGRAATRALRARYRDLLGALAAADLAAVVEPDLRVLNLATVGARLSDLAEAAVRAALAVATAEVTGGITGEIPGQAVPLAVIGMGKCGGRELNYVSDIDVIFVAEAEEHLTRADRLAATTMRITGESCFPIDAALRPEGRSGPLVRTLDSHLSYYRRWARTWEFQALLKARPIAGDLRLGQSYVDAVEPMVWQAADRADFVADVQAMRRMVENHVPPELVDRELKLGRGGLRDVEFAVQLLQLVHGRADETLHVRSTVDALRALGRGGYVGRDDAANLAASYEFLRLLEHRLQLQRLRRTHLLPAETDTAALRWLARASGFGAIRRRDPVEVLLGEVRHNAHRVRRLHEKLFYRPLLEAVAKVPTEALRLTPEAATARLAALGYTSPEGALRHLQSLTSGMTRRAAIQTALLPVLLDMLADTPDPDGGLLAYRRVSEALADTPWYLRLLRDEGKVAQRLMAVLGMSKFVPDLLVRAPEVLQLLTDDVALAGRDPAEVAASLHSTVNRHTDPEAAVVAARSLRRHEMLRVACADLLGLMDVHQVCAVLSSVWAAVLAAALDVAVRVEATRRGLDTASATIAVIGMGRLGGAELGYGSDADVLFVCSPAAGAVDDNDAVRFATSVAETVRRLLAAPSQDPALQVDADLRPEGRSGPLVRTLASYRAYYEQWSDIWEAQALLRASFVAGDAALGQAFLDAIAPVRYPPGGLQAARVTEIRRIKARVDTERLPRGADPTTHTKLGRGGLADIEWTVQLLQLRHAHEVPALRTTSTVDGLRAAADAGLLTMADAAVLDAAWRLVTRARNAATLVHGKPTDQLPRSGRALAAVARALGYPPGADPGIFVDDYRRTARRARAVVERVFYD